MDIEVFVKEKNYPIKIDDAFRELFKMMYYKIDIVLTHNILKLIFKNENSSNIESVAYSCLREKIIEIVKTNQIDYKICKIDEEHMKSYKFLSIFEYMWLVLDITNFKHLVMLLHPIEHKYFKGYFICFENLILKYNDYKNDEYIKSIRLESDKLVRYVEKEKDEKIKEMEFSYKKAIRNNNNKTKNKLLEYALKKKTKFIYIISTEKDAKCDRYMIGVTNDVKELMKRLKTDNNDNFYCYYMEQIYNAKILNLHVKKLFKRFEDKSCKDLYNMNYRLLYHNLKKIVYYHNYSTEIINIFIKNEIDDNVVPGKCLPKPIPV